MIRQVISPQWIAKMYTGKPGRDHLGLGSVSSDLILPSLSPSVNVLTFHPRYHSFYVFLLDEYWQRIPEKSRNHWIAFYRPHEYIYSLGIYLHENEHGELRNVVGGQETGPLASKGLKSYLSNFDYIDSDLGGYGLYYRTVMAEMGLIYPGGRGFPTPVDVPSEFGRDIAAAFRKSVEHTKYYKKYFDHSQEEIPTEVILEYVESACLCRLKLEDAPDHDIVLDSFLTQGGTVAATARTATFRLFLDIAEQTNRNSIDENTFRQLIYFQQSDQGLKYSPQPDLIETYVRWRLYQLREYYAFALNALWFHLCDWGIRENGHLQPISMGQIWDYLESQLSFDVLFTKLGLPKKRFTYQTSTKEILDWLRNNIIGKHTDIEKPFDIKSPFSENGLYKHFRNNQSYKTDIPAMTILLLLVYLRLEDKSLRLRPEWEINRMGMNRRLSVDLYVRTMDDFLASGSVTIGEFLKWIIQDYVIIQHQAVATSKLPDNTFRFQRQGDKLRFYVHENNLNFMNSRFDAIATTVHELGLCGNLGLPKHALTREGKRLLAKGEL